MNILNFTLNVISQITIDVEISKDKSFSNPQIKKLFTMISPIEEREVVVVNSTFNLKYIFFRYQDDIVFIGPFLTKEINEDEMDDSLLSSLGSERSKLKLIPVVPDNGLFRPLMSSLFDEIWGKGNYTLRSLSDKKHKNIVFSAESLEHYNANEISRRYKEEAKLLDAVRRSDFEFLNKIFSSFDINDTVEKRNSNAVRNVQNYSIIMNTLLRKTAYDAGVAAIYVDRLSSFFGNRIENLSTSFAVSSLMVEMLSEYASLIRDYSWSGYPEKIKSVLYAIDSRYKEHLTLDELGEIAGLSPYHLSHLFSKVLGKTVFEYLAIVRINKSLTLLKNPDITIAQASIDSGFEDQSYYTRTFKRIMGKTPTKWRLEYI